MGAQRCHFEPNLRRAFRMSSTSSMSCAPGPASHWVVSGPPKAMSCVSSARFRYERSRRAWSSATDCGARACEQQKWKASQLPTSANKLVAYGSYRCQLVRVGGAQSEANKERVSRWQVKISPAQRAFAFPNVARDVSLPWQHLNKQTRGAGLSPIAPAAVALAVCKVPYTSCNLPTALCQCEHCRPVQNVRIAVLLSNSKCAIKRGRSSFWISDLK